MSRIVNPTLQGREWGDGYGRTSEHVIEDISFEGGWTLCACGERVWATDTLTTEDAWDMHRGRGDLVVTRALNPDHEPQASNAEVHEFLELVRNPDFEFETGEAE